MINLSQHILLWDPAEARDTVQASLYLKEQSCMESRSG